MTWEISGRYQSGKVCEYRSAKTGAKVWLHGRRWVASPFGNRLRGPKGGVRLFRTAQAAIKAANSEVVELTTMQGPYFRITRSAQAINAAPYGGKEG